MAVKLVSRQWQSLLQRGLDGASEAADVVAHRLRVAADPRARLLRKRKWALWVGLAFASATVMLALVTALLASWSIPAWALLIPGLLAAGAAFPATLLLLRFRWLRSTPLPAQRPVSIRRPPPHGSAARPAMSALGASERGLFSLLGVIERGELLPTEEIRELTLAANQSSTTMAATAQEVVSMERAAAASPNSRAHLAPTINAFTAQLGTGVRQYNEMVTAAAQLVSAANGSAANGSAANGSAANSSAANGGGMSASPMVQQRYRSELTNATDRLLGWAQAFEELGEQDSRRRA